MRLSETLKAATEMETDPMWAVARRLSYLAGRYFDLKIEMQEDAEYEAVNELEELIWAEHIIASAHEVSLIRREQKSLQNWVERSKKKQVISDDDVANARNYPIDQLIEFNRGKVACPFHEDKNPSAYHGTKTNRLVCPVCNETWSALDILVKRDGINFVEAVKQLRG